MKSAILSKGERFYTYMHKILEAMGNEQVNYNWLITDCECYPADKEFRELFSQEYIWITGEKLTEVIDREDFQFIWAVLSGFPRENSLGEVLKYDLPFADGYKGFWVDNVGIQHPVADIEIVAFDSSFTLFISKNDDLVDRFRRCFPLSEDLSAQNTRNNSEIAHVEELMLREFERRNIPIDEEKLHQKYAVWNDLYSDRLVSVKDEDILHQIDDMLSK